MHFLETEAPGADLSSLHHTHDILFDQYSRYRACAELLLRLGATASSRILDVGSGSACLLSDFLPDFDISYVDPLINALPTKKSNQYGYQIDEVADKLGLFDYVVAIDVLEHVPPQFRDGFTSTLVSLATKAIVLAFPYEDEPSPAGVDRTVNADYAYINNRSYSWLKEHKEYGLPNAAKLKSAFAMRGLDAEYFHHGYAPWLEELLSYVINVNDIPGAKMLGHEVSREFNQKLFGYDFNQPGYRVFLVTAKVTLPEGWRPPLKPIDTNAKKMFTDMMRKAYLRLIVNLQLSDQKIADIKIEQARALADRDTALADRSTATADRDAAIADRDAASAQAEVLKKKNQQAEALIVQMQCSKSWRLTKPLRILGRLARYGLTKNDAHRLANIVKPYWRMLPIPHELRQSISTRVRRFLAPAITAPSVDLAKPESLPALATNEVGKPDYFVFSVIDWYFRHQRPQQLALQIAETGRRVFYISVDFVDHAEPGFAVESLDTSGRLFNLHLHLQGAPSVYGKPPTAEQMIQLSLSMGNLLQWTKSASVVSLIQHSFWSALAARMPNSRLVYDCMDHHEGFGGVSDEMIAHERALLSAADLTVTTSLWLDNEVADKTSRHILIRNATEFDHFAKTPVDIYKEPLGRRVIGYYGAIAEWFDVDLMVQVAQAFPECAVVMIGADTIGAQKKLAGCKNVSFLGEIPYKELPRYAHAFDVCLLPFMVIPLTLATNPVKAYEYLSMGKHVVSTGLPEVREMGTVCEVANDTAEFVSLVRKCLDQPGDASERQAFAKAQTWAHRAKALIEVSEDHKHDPLVSVIVVTYNNLELTKQCLASLDEYSDYPNMEVIVVDNASSDGSPEWLQQWGAAEGHNRKLILNADNRGFAAGNNLGLAIASGEYLVMLNNDTHVTPGWVRTMVNHMRRNPDLGLLGPVTNNIGNEARIDIFYDDMTQMMALSSQYTRSHVGQLYPLRTAAFFCVMLKRSVFDKIGLLDEAFGRGFFEDDDYCKRIEQAGLKVACAEDVFVHHHLSASFNKLKSHDRQKLFEGNRKVYEAKWGPWIPHKFRPPAR